MTDPTSPCVGVCELDAAGACSGCLRTVDEIVAWGAMSPEDRVAVMATLGGRRAAPAPDRDAAR